MKEYYEEQYEEKQVQLALAQNGFLAEFQRIWTKHYMPTGSTVDKLEFAIVSADIQMLYRQLQAIKSLKQSMDYIYKDLKKYEEEERKQLNAQEDLQEDGGL